MLTRKKEVVQMDQDMKEAHWFIYFTQEGVLEGA